MKKYLTLGFTTFLLASFNLNAALVIDWGGMDYLPDTTGTGIKSFRGGGNNPAGVDNGTTRTWAYNDTTPLSPSPTSPTYAGTSATFYGAMQFTYASGAANYTTARVDNNNDVSRLNISTPVNSGVQQDIAGFLAWKKADFLNGGSSNASSLASGSTLSLITSAASGGTSTSFRAILQFGGNWYLSQASVAGTASATTKTIDLYSSAWALWDADNTPLDVIPGSFTVASSTFTNIQAMGFYYSGSRTNTMSIIVDSVEANLNVVPEPTTWGLLAGSLTALVIFRRRRRM